MGVGSGRGYRRVNGVGLRTPAVLCQLRCGVSSTSSWRSCSTFEARESEAACDSQFLLLMEPKHVAVALLAAAGAYLFYIRTTQPLKKPLKVKVFGLYFTPTPTPTQTLGSLRRACLVWFG